MRFYTHHRNTLKATIMASAVMAFAVLGLTGCHIEYEDEMNASAQGETMGEAGDTYLRFTYTDETYTDYFSYAITEYEKANPNVHITLDLLESSDYVTDLTNASLSEETVSDLYLIDNATLGTAYLAGVAGPVTLEDSENLFCEAAIHSCSYNGAMIAYPLSYRTTFMVYNADYLPEGVTISTFEDIENFAGTIFGDEDTAEGETETAAEENAIDYAKVETIFEANITELFRNYGYIGAGMNIGGEDGSNSEEVSVCNDRSVSLAKQYLELVEYFSINSSREDDVIFERFVEGKSIFAILSTSYVDKLINVNAQEETTAVETTAGAEGETAAEAVATPEFHYGILAFPDYDTENKTAPLSLTEAIAVNPFSAQNEAAEAFARYLTVELADKVFPLSGELSACKKAVYEETELANIYLSYEKSVAKNKIRYGEQIYPLIEIALHNILAGNDITEELTAVDTYMKSQLN